MPKILITGSSGQIGTNLFHHLSAIDGYSVLGIDKRRNDWDPSLETHIVDMADADQSESFARQHLEDVDLVVHLAAYAKVFELVEHPDRALENITMTFRALEFCRRRSIPIIFGSSREVYGDIERIITGESDADFVIAESPYSASKISGEALTYSYARCYGLNYLIFRFSNVYGRFDNDLVRMTRVMPIFIDKIFRGEEVTVFGEDKVLDFTYVDDCVGGIALGIDSLLTNKVTDQTFNLARGEGATLVALAEGIADELGRQLKMNSQPSRPGEVTHYVANIGKARALLGYDPQVSLGEGISRTIAWWKETGLL
ncbi:MAG: NAD-dependent epimerase/dehydratase family protein [Planctomycetota bacterium]|jgi:UDP-glucose 4-epimerase|nr:NAD-dependent epimerase/dehydratase family protein [Planctomycetota bacterium]